MRTRFLELAASVVDGRVEALKAELEVTSEVQGDCANARDRAAIAEAEHCARLIRALADARPRRVGAPYAIARESWARGGGRRD